jgi:hypothetical protein
MPKEICENTIHRGKHTNVKQVKLTDDFENETCYWCEKCRKRDFDMIAEEI